MLQFQLDQHRPFFLIFRKNKILAFQIDNAGLCALDLLNDFRRQILSFRVLAKVDFFAFGKRLRNTCIEFFQHFTDKNSQFLVFLHLDWKGPVFASRENRLYAFKP